MLCDTTYFDELYGVRLLRYQFKEDEEWRSVFARACEDHPDINIGGKSTRRLPTDRIPSWRFLHRRIHPNGHGQCRITVQDGSGGTAQLCPVSTILDSSFNGIMKVTNNGTVLVMNR